MNVITYLDRAAKTMVQDPWQCALPEFGKQLLLRAGLY